MKTPFDPLFCLAAGTLATAMVMLPAVACAQAKAKGQKEYHDLPASMMQWATRGDGTPLMAVTAWGDSKAGPHGTLVKLPAGMVSPPHLHSHDMNAIVVSGTVSHLPVGANPSTERPLPPGSHYFIPGMLKHVSKCAAGADCIILIVQDEGADSVVDPKDLPKGGPKPAAAR